MNNIKDTIHQLIGDFAENRPQEYNKIQNIWNNIVDEVDKEHTCLVSYKNGCLVILVDSSVYGYQMTLKKTKLLARLKEGIEDIKNIYFKIGKVK